MIDATILTYFMVNAFIAGMVMNEKGFKWWHIVAAFLFGSLIWISLFIWDAIKWIDKHIEASTLYRLYFTDYWEKQFDHKDDLYYSPEQRIKMFRDLYKHPKQTRYRRWVIRQIDKKYNFGITK